MVKNPPDNVGYLRDMGLICGSGRCPVGGLGNPLLSCITPWMAEPGGLQSIGSLRVRHN